MPLSSNLVHTPETSCVVPFQNGQSVKTSLQCVHVTYNSGVIKAFELKLGTRVTN